MKRFLRNKSGATAIEYGLLVAILALAILTVMTATGQKVSNSLNRVTTALN